MAAKSELQLLGSWASPFSNRVQMALKLKSVPHEYINEEDFYSNKSDRLLKANPVYKKIPVLIHGQKPICESLVIIQYIDEVWTNGPSILPSDPYERARARFWAAYVDNTWFPTFMAILKAPGEEARAAAIEKCFEGLPMLEEAFVKCGKGKLFFGGDNVGYIDLVLGSYLGWLKVAEVQFGLKVLDETRTPNLAAWAERFVVHNVAKDFITAPQQLIEHYNRVQAFRAASSLKK